MPDERVMHGSGSAVSACAADTCRRDVGSNFFGRGSVASRHGETSHAARPLRHSSCAAVVDAEARQSRMRRSRGAMPRRARAMRAWLDAADVAPVTRVSRGHDAHRPVDECRVDPSRSVRSARRIHRRGARREVERRVEDECGCGSERWMSEDDRYVLPGTSLLAPRRLRRCTRAEVTGSHAWKAPRVSSASTSAPDRRRECSRREGGSAL
jgi:hypothetical protein